MTSSIDPRALAADPLWKSKSLFLHFLRRSNWSDDEVIEELAADFRRISPVFGSSSSSSKLAGSAFRFIGAAVKVFSDCQASLCTN